MTELFVILVVAGAMMVVGVVLLFAGVKSKTDSTFMIGGILTFLGIVMLLTLMGMQDVVSKAS